MSQRLRCAHTGPRLVHMLSTYLHKQNQTKEKKTKTKTLHHRHSFKTNIIYVFAQMQTFENDSWSQFDRYKLLINNKK